MIVRIIRVSDYDYKNYNTAVWSAIKLIKEFGNTIVIRISKDKYQLVEVNTKSPFIDDIINDMNDVQSLDTENDYVGFVYFFEGWNGEKKPVYVDLCSDRVW